MILKTIPLSGPGAAGKFLLYRPLAGLAFVGNRSMKELTEKIAAQPDAEYSGEAVEFLRAADFFSPDPPAPPPAGGGFRPIMAVLLLTNRCQLRCAYCYAAAGEHVPMELSTAFSRAAIDAVCENASAKSLPYFELSFHGGGEPTLAWAALREAILYAREKPLKARVSLTSNGIWPADQEAWLLDNLDHLSLSMDGSPGIQDRNRPFAAGGGSSAIVMRRIAELDRRRFPYGIRMTAVAPWEDLPRQVQFLCAETGCPSFQVEPAFNTRRGGHAEPDPKEALAFADAFLESFDLALRAGRFLTYSGARPGTVTSSFCSAPYDALIVNPRGNLVSCYEVADSDHPLADLSGIGRIGERGLQVDEPNRLRLHSWLESWRETCRDCFCYWSCAGDCYTRSFHAGPDGRLARGARCVINRRVTEQLLLRGIAEGGGIWSSRRSRSTRRPSPPAAIHI